MHRHRPWRGLQAAAWDLWQRWLSEIIADFWAVAMLGASASSGMIGVLSLPRAFVFRISADDPHPAPFIRARLSCAIGQALYPDDQWGRLDRLWRSFYPLAGVSAAHRAMLAALEATMPGLVRLLVEHRPASLRGLSMRACLPVAERQPANLRALFPAGGTAPSRLRGMRPTLAFAVFGQARLDGRVDAGGESEQLGRLLEHWALRRGGGELTALDARRGKELLRPEENENELKAHT